MLDRDPYKTINFVKKQIQIRNASGEIIFNNEIEFPEDFDDSHAAIVASRYLCNNAKRKETSLKDMIDRVSDEITNWARKDGYFRSEEDLADFNYKLKYYQINGYFAFNSPVYFNVGLTDKPQTSACFILEIEDNMESIFELAKIESRIFKHGSGSGVNMSTLRSSKERVSRGGFACLTGSVQVECKDTSEKITISKLYKYKVNNQQLPLIKCMIENNQIGYNRINDVVYNGKREVYLVITSKGKSIKATLNHRFLDENGEFKYLRDFKVGDKIGVSEDSVVGFESIIEISYVSREDVYDLQMAPPYHNFVANGFISHNSGPISFLKAHDTVAGVIKSGGTLRRSAKLVCLDDYHPDIEEFICCKDKEEEKLRILTNAGIKPDPGYDMSDEVFYQNTNISVRLSDKFMEAVEKDAEWELRYINTPGIYKKIKARDLLRKIAEHAWRTGDPGVQFSDTFNKWNTVLNDGEIKSTNPYTTCGISQ